MRNNVLIATSLVWDSIIANNHNIALSGNDTANSTSSNEDSSNQVMDPSTRNALLIGILVPVSILIITFLLIFIIRRIRQRKHSYNQLNGDFDEEEIEFKRMIESSHGTPDDDLEAFLAEDGGDDFEFSAKDQDRLSMLEKLRSNLVSSSEDVNSNSESENEGEGEKDSLRM